eukprot:Hpha_TRINITY_DN16482_c1_g1::TRINITY_DN16482_c1_g1_i1::g.163412::m.163412
MSCGGPCPGGSNSCHQGNGQECWDMFLKPNTNGVVSVPEFREAMQTLALFLEKSFLTSDGKGVDAGEALHFMRSEQSAMAQSEVVERPFGLPVKSGVTCLRQPQWAAIQDFINSGMWYHDVPANPADKEDPLLASRLNYGAFMLGFDFHVSDGDAVPKLIEVNTNAGGLATVFQASGCAPERQVILSKFHQAIAEEYRAFVGSLPPEAAGAFPETPNVAIVDDNALEQGLYMEMLLFADVLKMRGMEAVVCSPADLDADDSGALTHTRTGRRIHFVYNRLAPDFRLQEEGHLHLRAAAVRHAACISPHPAAYARIADKRLLKRLSEAAAHPCVPRTMLLQDRPMEEWVQEKKKWVFKPPEGNASRGVYRGDKVSRTVMATLPPDTIAQELCDPGRSLEDMTKYDVRVYSHGKKIIALASRHFTGQVMEMRSEKSGFRLALPEGVCCLPML